MKSVRVLIADDSVIFRSQIKLALAGVEGVEVVGSASNGKIALDRLGQTEIDLVTLDLEMPEVDGIEMLKRMKDRGLIRKTIVFSAVSKKGADITLEALRLGASDFVAKPGSEAGEGGISLQPHEKIKALLLPKIYGLFPSIFRTEVPLLKERLTAAPSATWDVFSPEVIVIGSSTGGPTALEKIFASIGGPIKCPILVAQHMPPVFTACLAERLGKLANMPSREAAHLDMLEPNHIYVAPGNFHMRLVKQGLGVQIRLDQGPLINSVRPAVDPLFESAAQIYKTKCLGIVLTGMGEDGKVGARAIKGMGGLITIQDKASSVVFGMPGAIFNDGSYDKIGNLEEISSLIRMKGAA